jgi:hypothetical protein
VEEMVQEDKVERVFAVPCLAIVFLKEGEE